MAACRSIPGIHAQAYRRETLGRVVTLNPFVGLRMGLECGVNEY